MMRNLEAVRCSEIVAETLRCGECARESDGDWDNHRVTCRGTAMVERVFPRAR